MKTLQNHILIYDSDCPMCKIYSKGFIKTGMLDGNGRQAFSEISPEIKSILDFPRSKNEIALIDTTENTVIYGLESLLTIIGNSFPTLEKTARIRPFHWLFERLYRLVSYNRKQIIPSPNDYTETNCVPDFNLKYRMSYVVLVLIFSVIILKFINQQLAATFRSDFHWVIFLFFVQIVMQMISVAIFSKDRFWDFLGNMMTVFLIGSLLLIPMIFLNFNQFFFLIYWTVIYLIMFLELQRRFKILKMDGFPTITLLIFNILFITAYLINVFN